jgi:outer membrane protein assembly factor BamB/predicted Ser/Thr protein kinase
MDSNDSRRHPASSDAGETLPLREGAASEPPELARVLEEHMAALAAGKTPDREAILGAHPAIAGMLRECLSAIEFIHGASKTIAGTSGAAGAAPPQLGDFRILREIGSGGMGVVYEAEQISLGRRVALKVLRFGPASDPEAMKRFHREAETVARLHHTSIVPIFAVGAERGVPYYAMQFIEGESLAAAAERAARDAAPLGEADVAAWGLQAAEALEHAHQRGVIHRDVKPSNLLLDRERRVWLADFGLARRLDDAALSLSGVLLGTPRYMSPEQASPARRPVDHRTDVYSLGATLYELLTGRPAFDAETPQAVIAQILEKEPAPPARIRPGLSPDLETIVLKCLEKDPAHRYATARDLAEDLRAFLDGRDIRARTPSLAERAARWLRRNRRLAATAAAAALSSAALVAGVLFGWRRYEESRLGKLKLETSRSGLVAEVLDDGGRAVVPAFAVPTLEPATIPEGSYRLRLSASGLPSETWGIEVERGLEQSFAVEPRRRWLWPPMELRPDEFPEVEIVDLESRADIIVLSHQAPLAGGGLGRRIRRFDGRSGRALWTLDFDVSTLPDGVPLAEWSGLLAHSGLLQSDHLLLRPEVDLSGDGVADLVWLGRNTPSLLAVSGADGAVLWLFRGRPELPEDARGLDGAFDAGGRGAVVGRPALPDVDGDGVADLIACLVSEGGVFRSIAGRRAAAKPQGWIEAVSGRTGRSLWRRAAPAGSFKHARDSDAARLGERRCRPRAVALGGRGAVLVLPAFGSKLFALDLASGADLRPPLELPFEPSEAPAVADLDGDGEPEALLISIAEERPELTLSAFSLKARTALWSAAFQPTSSRHALEGSAHAWYLAEDLDGDGRAELVFPSGELADAYRDAHRGGITAIDSATGARRWERRFGNDPIERFLVGPDIDADGAREVFASWYGYDPEARRPRLFAAALSGADGRTLWRFGREASGSRAVPDASGPMRWWHADEDGWPLLLLPTTSGPGGLWTTYILSSATGELRDAIAGAHTPEVADFTGDGIGDLVYRVEPQGAPRLLVVPGAPPEPWRRLGQWHAAGDLDGDGFTDLIGAERGDGGGVTARSGRSQEVLWRIRGARMPSGGSLLEPPAVSSDIDGDGAPDPVFFEHASFLSSDLAVAAFSGKDGRRLWSAAHLDVAPSSESGVRNHWSYRHPAIDSLDLDRDGRGEVLVLHGVRSAMGRRGLSALAGADGRLLWQTPAAAGTIGIDPAHGALFAEDLDGDGWRDPALWAPAGDGATAADGPFELRAVSGRDGKPLWSAPSTRVEAENEILWPRAEGGDLDGDGAPEIVVAARRGAGECLVAALDGRSGAARWTWKPASSDLLPPCIVDFDGRGRRSVAIGAYAASGPRIAIFDAAGAIEEEIPLDLTGHGLQETAQLWGHGDLDGDGREELIYFSGGAVCAAGRGGEVRWRRPLSRGGGGAPRLAGMARGGRARDGAGGAALLSIWSGSSILGLDGAGGEPLWRCEVPWAPAAGGSPAPALHRLEAGGAAALPRYLSVWRQTGADQWATAVRQAWPADSEGRFAPPAARAVERRPVDDAPIRRALPWTRGYFWRSAAFYPAIGFVIFLAAVLPGWWTRWALERGAPKLTLIAVLWGAAVLGLIQDPEGPMRLALLVLAAVPGQVAFAAARRRSRPLVAIAGAGPALAGERYSAAGWHLAWPLGAYGTGAMALVAALARRARAPAAGRRSL